jgi:HD-like signal output (HDOD) protein
MAEHLTPPEAAGARWRSRSAPSRRLPQRRGTLPVPTHVQRGIERLTPLPITTNRLIAILQKEESSLAAVADLIEFDEVIAARVLRLARSAAYAGRMPIGSVREAVMRLGATTILELALGTYLKALKASAPLYDIDEDDLWAHAAASALAVRALAAECPTLRLPAMAQPAALIHDIGKLVIVRTVQLRPRDILEACRARQQTWIESERELIGFDHAEVGGLLARHWNLPTELADAIEQHHDLPIAHPTPLIDAVVFANYVAKSIGTGLGAEGLNIRMDAAVSARFGVSHASFDRICLQTWTWLTDLRQSVAA